jgi:hypothetical protein
MRRPRTFANANASAGRADLLSALPCVKKAIDGFAAHALAASDRETQ